MDLLDRSCGRFGAIMGQETDVGQNLSPAQPTSSPPRRGKFRAMLIRLIGYPLLAYLAVIVLLMLFENYLLYHPVRASSSWYPAAPELNAQDVEWTLSDGTRIHGWWCPVPRAEGVVLFCHGNAGNLSQRGGMVGCWQKQVGVSVLIFDYPGFGKSEGSVSEAGCYAAADGAVDWLLREGKVAVERLYLFGES